MTLLRRQMIATLLCVPLLVRAHETPLKFEGLLFDRQLSLAGSDLLLNGTGLRAVAWFKGFAAALYLKSRARLATDVVGMTGPKRLQLRMLREVPAEEFAKAFKKGVSRNAASDALPGLAERMERFAALVGELGTARKGDIINLDFEPGRGLLFSVNGTLRGHAVAGDDFYAALLRAFVGEHPYDERLKAGLLGQAA